MRLLKAKPRLSGIDYTRFIGQIWYRKTVIFRKDENRVFLHIGAADYLTSVLYEHVLQEHPGRQTYHGEPVFISEYGGCRADVT